MKYKLKDIFDLQMGKTPARNNRNYWNTKENKWISIADLSKTGKYISTTKEYLSDAAVEESGIKVIPANTVVMSFKLSIGKTAITTEEMYSNEAIMAFHDRRVVDILPEYVFYMFKYRNWEEGSNKAVMGKTLNKAILSDVEIEICPIEKQREIVAVLDKLMAVLEHREDELQLLDKLIKARFVELTNKEKTVPTRMGDVATYVNGYAFKPTDWKNEGLPIIRIQNLNDSNALYNYFDGKINEKYRIHKGDVLVSWATHLEAYIWKGQDAWLNQHIFKVEFNKMEINKIYFVYSTEEALRQAFKNAHGFKPTMEHIKRSDFENAVIQVPSMELQNQFADFVHQVNKSKVEVQKALDETQKLFDSLMQQYFG